MAVKLRIGDRDTVGMLGNIDLEDVRATREFASLSIRRGRSWFRLLRYFDVGYERSGPRQLAKLLGLQLGQVFPILYDISSVAVGNPQVVTGRFNAEPDVRLSKRDRLDLIFDRLRHRD